MSLDRRKLLKSVAAAGAAAAVSGGTSEARVRGTIPPDALGLMYDTTKCIGCKCCVVACNEQNGNPADIGNVEDRPHQGGSGRLSFLRACIDIIDGDLVDLHRQIRLRIRCDRVDQIRQAA